MNTQPKRLERGQPGWFRPRHIIVVGGLAALTLTTSTVAAGTGADAGSEEITLYK